MVEQLESRQLLAGDTAFADALPTAEQAQFGNTVLTQEGREVCLAFKSTGLAEGELAPPPLEADGDVDLSVLILNQPTGPLAPGAAFSSEITFENSVGFGDATASTLAVTFDAGLTGIQWEREVIRAQPAVIAAADLDTSSGISLPGVEAGDRSGFSVSGSGDFNNDGIDDFIIGATEPDISGSGQNGEIYVVFGSDTGFPAQIDLATLASADGLTIHGASAGSNAGTSVDNAGDINGDNIDDLIIGAPGADPGGLSDAGQVFVVYGKPTLGGQLDLATLASTDGVSIAGLGAEDALGTSVSGAEDVNGDGIADIIIGAPGKSVPTPGGSAGERDTVGAAYVVFGSASLGATVDLAALTGPNGFEISTAGVGDLLGISVDAAGDINNDGADDVVIGAVESSFNGGDDSGRVYVVYGKVPADPAFTSPISVTALDGNNGFSIDAPRAGHNFGTGVAGIGDFNNDGIDDLLMADAIFVPPVGDTVASRSYVLYGNNTFAADLDISGLNGTAGLVIDAPTPDYPLSMRVSGAGDVNGDGTPDLLVGLPEATIQEPGDPPTQTTLPGGGYVIFGSSGLSSPIGLETLDGTNGFLIEGRDALLSELAGDAVGAAGDVNDDGFDDLIIGAPFASPSSKILAGESYVVFGRGSTTTNGAGAINEILDLGPGDKVIYRVTATIAAGATSPTTVAATATAGAGIVDTNTGNNTASAETTIVPPPAVESIQINDGSPTRSQITSVTVTFDSVVDETTLDNAFQITQVDTGTPVGTINVAKDTTSVPGKTIATLTFAGASTVAREGVGALGNSLADGNYKLDILAANVVSGGTPMAADYEFGGHNAAVPAADNDDFFRLYGDGNGDGVVDTIDLFDHFAPAFQFGTPRPDMDGEGNGVIDTLDLFDFFGVAFSSQAARP
ncbi:beta strand repeat-containing protein [Stieleria neptunia]|uniref:beta strand repeat-containing protein n=1 Tax=Stieleria neptunia TaxID=2527979 RepID=UPI0018D26361|nr:integrin alpha [Stieleria neptunia]